MILEGILVGIFGNTIFAIIQGKVNEILGSSDDDLNKRVHDSLEEATKEFFQTYNETYTNPHDSFIARESNIRLIVTSLFYDNNINIFNEIDRRGFRSEQDVTEEHLQFFVDSLNRIMKKDFLLNKIITEKKHIEDAKIDSENIKKILDSITKQTNEQLETNSVQDKWQITDLETGEEKPLEKGKKYHQKFSNGVEYTYMLQKDTISVDYKDIYGRRSYYELDFEGNIINNKFPFPISEYKLIINESDVINRNITHLPNGDYLEELTLKWNRTSKGVFDKNHKIKQIEVSGGWHVNHNNKTFSPTED